MHLAGDGEAGGVREECESGELFVNKSVTFVARSSEKPYVLGCGAHSAAKLKLLIVGSTDVTEAEWLDDAEDDGNQTSSFKYASQVHVRFENCRLRSLNITIDYRSCFEQLADDVVNRSSISISASFEDVMSEDSSLQVTPPHYGQSDFSVSFKNSTWQGHHKLGCEETCGSTSSILIAVTNLNLTIINSNLFHTRVRTSSDKRTNIYMDGCHSSSRPHLERFFGEIFIEVNTQYPNSIRVLNSRFDHHVYESPIESI